MTTYERFIELDALKRAARWCREWKVNSLALTSPKYGSVVMVFTTRESMESELRHAA